MRTINRKLSTAAITASRHRTTFPATAAQDVRRGRYSDQSAAEKETYYRLDYIRQASTGMDELLEEIDRRNSQYSNASFLQLKYILNSSKDVVGQLMEALKYPADLRVVESFRPYVDLPEEFDRLFSLFSHGYIDWQSLYTAREAARSHTPAEFRELSGPGMEERRAVLRKCREKLARHMTRDKINAYILDKLGNRDSLNASELGVEEREDFFITRKNKVEDCRLEDSLLLAGKRPRNNCELKIFHFIP